MKLWACITAIIMTGAVCLALSLADRETAFQQRLTALQARKAMFRAQSEQVITTVAVPMIAEVNSLIAESQAIQDEARQLVDDANLPEAKQRIILRIVDNACDPNSLDGKRNTLELLKWIIQISLEDLTK